MINFHVKVFDRGTEGLRTSYVTCSLITEDKILGQKQWVRDFPNVPTREMGELKEAELALIGFHECLARYQRALRDTLRGSLQQEDHARSDPEYRRMVMGEFPKHSETDPATGPEPV